MWVDWGEITLFILLGCFLNGFRCSDWKESEKFPIFIQTHLPAYHHHRDGRMRTTDESTTNSQYRTVVGTESVNNKRWQHKSYCFMGVRSAITLFVILFIAPPPVCAPKAV